MLLFYMAEFDRKMILLGIHSSPHSLLLLLFHNVCSSQPQHCRQPMDFFSFLKEHHTAESVGVEVLPAGAYVLPTYCEYCHAADTAQCSADCPRPALYFQKKRPPFAKPNAQVWDPVTDEFRPPPSPQVTPSTLRQSSWLSIFSNSDGGD